MCISLERNLRLSSNLKIYRENLWLLFNSLTKVNTFEKKNSEVSAN